MYAAREQGNQAQKTIAQSIALGSAMSDALPDHSLARPIRSVPGADLWRARWPLLTFRSVRRRPRVAAPGIHHRDRRSWSNRVGGGPETGSSVLARGAQSVEALVTLAVRSHDGPPGVDVGRLRDRPHVRPVPCRRSAPHLPSKTRKLMRSGLNSRSSLASLPDADADADADADGRRPTRPKSSARGRRVHPVGHESAGRREVAATRGMPWRPQVHMKPLTRNAADPCNLLLTRPDSRPEGKPRARPWPWSP